MRIGRLGYALSAAITGDNPQLISTLHANRTMRVISLGALGDQEVMQAIAWRTLARVTGRAFTRTLIEPHVGRRPRHELRRYRADCGGPGLDDAILAQHTARAGIRAVAKLL